MTKIVKGKKPCFGVPGETRPSHEYVKKSHSEGGRTDVETRTRERQNWGETSYPAPSPQTRWSRPPLEGEREKSLFSSSEKRSGVGRVHLTMIYGLESEIERSIRRLDLQVNHERVRRIRQRVGTLNKSRITNYRKRVRSRRRLLLHQAGCRNVFMYCNLKKKQRKASLSP